MIRRSTWLTLGLFGLLLAGAVLWTRTRPDPTTIDAPVRPELEPLWAPIQVDSIRIEDNESGQVVEVRRDPEVLWMVVAPTPGGPGDVARIERAASWLASPFPRSVLEQPPGLAALGLAEPAVTVTVIEPNGILHVFSIGRQAPTGQSYYVQLKGSSRVLLVSDLGLSEVLGLLEEVPLAPATPTPEATGTLEGEPSPTP